MFSLFLIAVALAALLGIFVFGVFKGLKSPSQSGPVAQPTESEAIVAALREGDRPAAPPLAAPKMLPVDLAANLPTPDKPETHPGPQPKA